MGVCPVANIEGGWLMASFYVPRDLLTALSWADWLYDKGWASTHTEKGLRDDLGVGRRDTTKWSRPYDSNANAWNTMEM